MIYLLGFYDPDGYLFNKDGFDEFGGYYDNEGFYHPGEKNKHEFPDYKPSESHKDRKGGSKEEKQHTHKKRDDFEDDDDLIAAFERGDQVDDTYEDEDHHINKYLHEFKKVEDVIDIVDEDAHIEVYEDEYGNEIIEYQEPQVIAIPKN